MKKGDKNGPISEITPTERHDKLASAVGLKMLYLKREDLHPYESHKGRSIPYMIDFGAKNGAKSFAISSSGNAALAAALHVKKIGGSDPLKMTLDIFIGQHANPHKVEKLEALEDEAIRVIMKERPLQSLILAEQDGVTSLRQSTNDLALEGYISLAEEIVETIKSSGEKSGAVFIGSSSGTTAQALAQYFTKNNLPIQVHIVQTTSCHPLADAFDPHDIPDEKSIADAIVDQTAHRKDALIPLIQKTGGEGWVVTNEEIEIAQKVVSDNADVDLSTNGVLGIAGAMQATYTGHKFDGPVVCVVGGE